MGRPPRSPSGATPAAWGALGFGALKVFVGTSPPRRPRGRRSFTSWPAGALGRHCLNETVALAGRRPGPAPRPGMQKDAPGYVAPHSAQVAARGDGGDPGRSHRCSRFPLSKRPARPPSPGRRSGAAGGRQLSSSSAPGLHCQSLTVPWPTEDQGPVHHCQSLTAPPRRPGDLGRHAAGYPEPYSYLRSAPFRPGRLR
jgi:hypothetical protein